MKYLFFLGLLFLLACAIHPKVMTRDKYARVEVGMKASDIEHRFGKPYQIVSREGGKETYEYIEKIKMGNQVIEQRRYYIVIQEGKVIGKYMKLSNPPPFEALYSEDPYPNY
ncbi:MAG: hypothetical protein QNJ27_01505 [Simkaniaceae bacterium]|nr:hypothetical protein [Simkaniaceae bacterium]